MVERKIMITGVSGSMGKALATYFTERNFTVYGSLRKPYPGLTLPIDPDKHVYIDLSEDMEYGIPEDLDAVVHCAAATSESSTSIRYSTTVNVEGTSRLVQACKKAGTRRLIYISTMSANPSNPSVYAQTKLGAEHVLEQDKDLDYVILRPGLVISAIPRGIFAKMKNYVNKLPVIPIVGNKSNLATISMGDLCAAVEETIRNEQASRLKIDVCANESLSIRQIVKLIAKQSGKNVVCLTIPYGVALFIARLSDLLGMSLLTKDNVYGLQYARKAETTLLNQVLGLVPDTFEKTLSRYMNDGRIQS